MALLCAKVDTDLIQLLGRWRSDLMLRYLQVQAQPVMQKFARSWFKEANSRSFLAKTFPTSRIRKLSPTIFYPMHQPIQLANLFPH
jgi:hypothetical protein